MSQQFGHNSNRARRSQAQAGTSGLQPLGQQGQVGPAGVGASIQPQGGSQLTGAGNASPGAIVSAVGAYGSPGSGISSQHGSINGASPFGISLGQSQPQIFTPGSSMSSACGRGVGGVVPAPRAPVRTRAERARLGAEIAKSSCFALRLPQGRGQDRCRIVKAPRSAASRDHQGRTCWS